MKKLLTKLAPLALLVLMVACADKYQEGLDDGKKQGYEQGYDEAYDVGYDQGYAAGDTDGFERAKAYFESAGYNEGFADGKAQGISIGYNNGYTVGKNETYQPAYNSGYSAGKADGKAQGYTMGYGDGYDDGFEDGYDDRNNPLYTAGYNAGYSNGYYDGDADGYNDGYDDGHYDGYDAGYDVGYDDGWYDGSFSVGKAAKLRGYSNILSLAHNDIFDYSKIPSPKVTKRGLVANGQLLFSETSLTNKDTLKRSAAAEQFLVVEMAKQVEGKFGLSTERSLKLAKASNHFRKQASNRSLTADDTNAYASEIIGSDFTAITKAYENTLKGDVSAFQAVLENAAEKNETSPENISLILTKYFM